jgi:hypothetical protein
MLGHPADHPLRRRPEPVRPALPDQVEVAADPPGRHDDGRRVQLELADLGARAARSAGRVAGLQDRATHAVHGPAGDGELVHPVPEPEPDQVVRCRGPHPPLERRQHPGSGAPGDMETRHRVAVPVGQVTAPLGPAHQGKPAHPHRVQPGAFLPGGEVDVGLRPPVGPVVLPGRVVDAAVEIRAARPVLPGQFQGVLDPHPALLRRVHQEQAAERPERLAAQVRLGLLVQQQHAPTDARQLGGGGQSRQPGAHHDHVRIHEVIQSHPLPSRPGLNREGEPSRSRKIAW